VADTNTKTRPKTPAEAPDLTIAFDPHRRGRHNARLVHYGRPVWALIADLQGNGWDVAQTARDYALPEEAVRAAIAYYEADPKYIDAFLLLNRDAFGA
jgi:uncharacterized protein (DUF433 family)